MDEETIIFYSLSLVSQFVVESSVSMIYQKFKKERRRRKLSSSRNDDLDFFLRAYFSSKSSKVTKGLGSLSCNLSTIQENHCHHQRFFRFTAVEVDEILHLLAIDPDSRMNSNLSVGT